MHCTMDTLANVVGTWMLWQKEAAWTDVVIVWAWAYILWNTDTRIVRAWMPWFWFEGLGSPHQHGQCRYHPHHHEQKHAAHPVTEGNSSYLSFNKGRGNGGEGEDGWGRGDRGGGGGGGIVDHPKP